MTTRWTIGNVRTLSSGRVFAGGVTVHELTVETLFSIDLSVAHTVCSSRCIFCCYSFRLLLSLAQLVDGRSASFWFFVVSVFKFYIVGSLKGYIPHFEIKSTSAPRAIDILHYFIMTLHNIEMKHLNSFNCSVVTSIFLYCDVHFLMALPRLQGWSVSCFK
jgi:hypothetical protein